MAERIVTGTVMSPERSAALTRSILGPLLGAKAAEKPPFIISAVAAALSTSLPSIPAHKMVKESLLLTVKPIYTVSS